jgi:hypothetical protein
MDTLYHPSRLAISVMDIPSSFQDKIRALLSFSNFQLAGPPNPPSPVITKNQCLCFLTVPGQLSGPNWPVAASSMTHYVRTDEKKALKQ